MPHYLVTIYHPDDYDPSLEDEAMGRAINSLNDEMVAAGLRVFVGGLHPAGSAKWVRARADGMGTITDGSYLKTSEHIGGLWVLDVASLDEAMEWGRKASVACRVPVEVRAFH
jgi:hypothetical protein